MFSTKIHISFYFDRCSPLSLKSSLDVTRHHTVEKIEIQFVVSGTLILRLVLSYCVWYSHVVSGTLTLCLVLSCCVWYSHVVSGTLTFPSYFCICFQIFFLLNYQRIDFSLTDTIINIKFCQILTINNVILYTFIYYIRKCLHQERDSFVYKLQFN
jgi:hypothetical protein